jgi:hypothetical protein
VASLAIGAIVLLGSVALLVLGHRPWYTWVTAVNGVGLIWVAASLHRARRLDG